MSRSSLSVDEFEEDEEQTAILTYLSMFEHHCDDFRRHIAGRSNWKSILPSSILPPGTEWTHEEKCAFFHGLAIYSRLRPGLIAEHIRMSVPPLSTMPSQTPLPAFQTYRDSFLPSKGSTKTAADVSDYIQQLEHASRLKGLPDDLSRSEFRARLPSARVLSAEWISNEEKWASELTIGHITANRVDIEQGRLDDIQRAGLRSNPQDEPTLLVTQDVPEDKNLDNLDPRINSKLNRVLKRTRDMLEGRRPSHSTSYFASSDDDDSSGMEPARKRRALESHWMAQDLLREIDSARADLLDELILRLNDPGRSERTEKQIVTAVTALSQSTGRMEDEAASNDGRATRTNKQTIQQKIALKLGSLLIAAKHSGVDAVTLENDRVDLFNHRHMHRVALAFHRGLMNSSLPPTKRKRKYTQPRIPWPFSSAASPGTSFLSSVDPISRNRLEPVIQYTTLQLLAAYVKLYTHRIVEKVCTLVNIESTSRAQDREKDDLLVHDDVTGYGKSDSSTSLPEITAGMIQKAVALVSEQPPLPARLFREQVFHRLRIPEPIESRGSADGKQDSKRVGVRKKSQLHRRGAVYANAKSRSLADDQEDNHANKGASGRRGWREPRHIVMIPRSSSSTSLDRTLRPSAPGLPDDADSDILDDDELDDDAAFERILDEEDDILADDEADDREYELKLMDEFGLGYPYPREGDEWGKTEESLDNDASDLNEDNGDQMRGAGSAVKDSSRSRVRMDRFKSKTTIDSDDEIFDDDSS